MHPTLRILSALLLLPLGLVAQIETGREPPPAPPPAADAAADDAAQELAARQAELSSVTEKITELQLKAENNEAVKASKDDYREALRTEMLRSSPDLAADIDRQAELVAELTSARTAEADAATTEAETTEKAAGDDRQAKLEEYRALHEKLSPVEQGVQNVPAVQSARKDYYDALIAEMQRINPQTPELLAKHRELVSVIRELAAQAQAG